MAALFSLIVLVGSAGSGSGPPVTDQPSCGVYAFTGNRVADERHGLLILGARVSSPDEALKIAREMALGMAKIVKLDVVEVYVNRPRDARAILVRGDADPAKTAIARVRHSLSRDADASDTWKAVLRTAHADAATRGRRNRPGYETLGATEIAARIARDPLGAAARETLCGIR